MPLNLTAIPNLDPDVIVIVFDGGHDETVRKTYCAAANAIIDDENELINIDRAIAYWFDGANVTSVNVTRRVEYFGEDFIKENERESRYEREDNNSLRHPSSVTKSPTVAESDDYNGDGSLREEPNRRDRQILSEQCLVVATACDLCVRGSAGDH